MNTTKIFLFLCNLFLFTACSPKTSTYLQQNTKVDLLQNVLYSIYQTNPNSVGIMAHLEGTKDRISWSGAAGRDGKDINKVLQKDQPIWIASNTKTYVAATILRLV